MKEIEFYKLPSGKNNFRLLGFEDKGTFIILTNGFKKKDKKVPKSEISLAQQKKMNIFQEENNMSDLKKYVAKRKQVDSEFAENFGNGYQEFKIGEMLKTARKETGLTQEEVATAMHTKKSAISRIENHAQDIRLSTLQAFAHIMGKELKIQLV